MYNTARFTLSNNNSIHCGDVFLATWTHNGVAPITQVTHVRNKNSNIQGRSLNVIKVSFPYYKELLIKVRIRSLWEQILSFKRSSHFEKGRNCRESLLDTVDSL